MDSESLKPVDLTKRKRTCKRTSDQDRMRIVQCARRGGDLKILAHQLGINIKTCRSIAATDRETALKRGSAKKKFSKEYVEKLRDLLNRNPQYTLRQMKSHMDQLYPQCPISISSVDRLLDNHHYIIQNGTNQQHAERNSKTTKAERAEYANWIQTTGSDLIRLYVDETSYHIWCSRNYGKSTSGELCTQIETSSKAANLNVLACMSNFGVLKYQSYPKITWFIFNEFLEACSTKLNEERPNMSAVFIFDNTPVHSRALDARLSNLHQVKYLPPHSPFFNPMDKVFGKFNQVSLASISQHTAFQFVKKWFSENADTVAQIPHGYTMKSHRQRILLSLCQPGFSEISPINCASYDLHTFTFVDAALRYEDL